MNVFARYQQRFKSAQDEEMSIQDYLELCKRDKAAALTGRSIFLCA